MVMCLKMPSNSMETSSSSSGGEEPLRDNASAEEKEQQQPSSSSTVDDGESASDEVKVYVEEGGDEREAKAYEGQSRDPLSDDKSTLITESELSKDARRHDLAFASRLFDPSLAQLGLQQYILNQQAAYALSLGRPSFWENALTGNPGSSAAHSGLRTPLYGLPPPPPHGQYPYSMLGPDQLAAWHQQAAVYHQAGFRAGSPYSLPITSGTMSRFSPGGLLGHPGLSPAAAAAASAANGGHHHLPQHLKQDLDGHHQGPGGPDHGGHGHGHHRVEKESKKKENHIKKPLNAFMLYMKEMRPVVQAECTLKESAAINQILGRRWHDLSREEQAKYYEKARTERQKHMEMYPNWNARDNYRFGLKKKKRKRDKADDPAASMKKCRARYGLDQQDLWCRPCRRKKKCIRVQAYMEGKAAAAAANNSSVAVSGPGSAGGNIGPGAMGISENGHAPHHHHHKLKNGNANSEDDDDDEDDDEDQSPDSRSLGSHSEQSLTSPAGFSSLNSLGSPASIASPSTPSMQFEAAVSQADLFRPSVFGAFKPPPPTSIAANHHQMMMAHHHHQQQQQQMFAHHFRPPVGTDPRDSKNPLSISQLTGNFCSSASPMGGSLAGPVVGGPPGGPPSDKRALPLMT